MGDPAPATTNISRFSAELLALEADPAFVALQQQLTRTNAFRILGTTFTERWHSQFWGWLLDPRGSHGQGGFALKRLLPMLARPDGSFEGVWLDPQGPDGEGWAPLPGSPPPFGAGDALRLRIRGSFCAPAEQSGFAEIGLRMEGVSEKDSRLDGLIALDLAADDVELTLLLILEFKVKDTYKSEQLTRYSRWLHVAPNPSAIGNKDPSLRQRLARLHGAGERPLLALGCFINMNSPDPKVERNPAPGKLTPAWSAVTYTDLIRQVLEPMSRQPGLDVASQGLIRNYIDNASHPESPIMNEAAQAQRELVLQFLAAHRNVFDVIIQVMAEEGQEDEAAALSEGRARAWGTSGERKLKVPPSRLVDLGILAAGARLEHNRRLPGVPEPIVAEFLGTDRRPLRWLEGGGSEIEGQHEAGALLQIIYRNHDQKFTDSGNRAWVVADGPDRGCSLAELYDRARQQG